MNTFKTKLGTELPLLNLKGKDYLQAAHRIQWFREEKPLWAIETECLSTTPEGTLFKATVSDENGRVIAIAHKTETLKGFPDHLEKAETGAISRALALCGYGTQFAQELEEEDRLADSPLAKPAAAPVGKTFGGLTQAQLGRLDAIAAKVKLPNAQLKNMAEGLGIKSRNEMTREQYDKLCTLIEGYRA